MQIRLRRRLRLEIPAIFSGLLCIYLGGDVHSIWLHTWCRFRARHFCENQDYLHYLQKQYMHGNAMLFTLC